MFQMRPVVKIRRPIQGGSIYADTWLKTSKQNSAVNSVDGCAQI